MMEKAIEKINAEMQKNPSDPYTEIVGHYVIDRCMDEAAAAKVCADKKTLKGAMEAVKNRARTAANNGVAVLLDCHVFDEVDKYFGLPLDLAAQQKAMAAVFESMATTFGVAPAQPAPPEPLARIKFDLADFF